MTVPSFMHLDSLFISEGKETTKRDTYKIRSANLVRCPKRCVTNIIVLPLRASLSCLNNSYSPSGSRAELGSSTVTNLMSSDNIRMKVRELSESVRHQR